MKSIERLLQYIDYKGFNKRSFEIDNNLSNGYLGKQLVRNADLGEGILVKILENCLDLSPEWLLTGRGEMLKSQNDKNSLSISQESEIDYKELYLEAKYTIEVQMKYIYTLEANIDSKKKTG